MARDTVDGARGMIELSAAPVGPPTRRPEELPVPDGDGSNVVPFRRSS
jgi:hypothetical protein